MNKSTVPDYAPKQCLYDHTVLSDDESCWLWVGGVSGSGYGMVPMGKHKRPYAHRISYEVHNGPIPAGMSVLHKCDNKRCVNPYHLFVGTQKDNMVDMVSKKRHMHGERTNTAKITEADVREIRALKEKGVTLSAIATQFGICFQQVSRIVRRERWAHVA